MYPISFIPIATIGLFLIATLLFKLFIKNSETYWILSATCSALIFACSFAILYRHYNFAQPDHAKESVAITNIQQEKTFLTQNAKKRNVKLTSQHLIPTGIIIKSLAIKDENIIALSGSI